ncbi:hypothetical protein Dda_8938 [Drechslerella dactyloides]|uniref:Uncharacterized protein n=1 Tax=Drechslerella dactyloides TaxID=74499 RepID=A0AAD6IU26_DREDA|nr:hypothetical protein Dda_8938 [Drechslerella dactyloides]
MPFFRSSSPVKIRMGIRDTWDAPKSPLRVAISELSKLLGTSVEVVVDWSMLWNVLSPQYPDPTTFVPCIEEATRVWAECLHERLDSDALEDWTDKFLEKFKTPGGMRTDIGVSENGMDRPEAVWEENRNRMSLLFPKKATGRVYLNTLQAGFRSDLENLFDRKSVATTSAAAPMTLPIGGVSAVDEDDWSVVPPTSAAAPAIAPVQRNFDTPQAQAPAEVLPEKLPTLATLARPEILFETQTPYLIYVRKYGDKALHIEGSHQGSLTLICEYFQKWVRKDRNYNGNCANFGFGFDYPQVLEIDKQTSLFGLNAGFDYVKISCNRWELLNPTPFLAFIEIVLKYKLVEASSGVTWFYRRDTKFI